MTHSVCSRNQISLFTCKFGSTPSKRHRGITKKKWRMSERSVTGHPLPLLSSPSSPFLIGPPEEAKIDHRWLHFVSISRGVGGVHVLSVLPFWELCCLCFSTHKHKIWNRWNTVNYEMQIHDFCRKVGPNGSKSSSGLTLKMRTEMVMKCL